MQDDTSAAARNLLPGDRLGPFCDRPGDELDLFSPGKVGQQLVHGLVVRWNFQVGSQIRQWSQDEASMTHSGMGEGQGGVLTL